MLTQAQYNALVTRVAETHDPNLADLLESFEVLHAILDGLCATGNSVVTYAAFEALYNDEGDQRVELVSHGRAPAPKLFVHDEPLRRLAGL